MPKMRINKAHWWNETMDIKRKHKCVRGEQTCVKRRKKMIIKREQMCNNEKRRVLEELGRDLFWMGDEYVLNESNGFKKKETKHQYWKRGWNRRVLKEGEERCIKRGKEIE